MKKYIENVKILKIVSSTGIPKLPKLINTPERWGKKTTKRVAETV